MNLTTFSKGNWRGLAPTLTRNAAGDGCSRTWDDSAAVSAAGVDVVLLDPGGEMVTPFFDLGQLAYLKLANLHSARRSGYDRRQGGFCEENVY